MLIPVFRNEFYRFIKNPMNIIFIICLPIFYLLLSGFSWNNIDIFNPNGDEKIVELLFPSIIIMNSIAISFASFGIIYSQDKIEKRIKHLSLSELKIKNFILSLTLFYYIIFCLIFVVLYIFAISLQWVTTDILYFTYTFIFTSLAFFLNFFITITIINFTKNFMTSIILLLFIMYLFIFLSGSATPTYLFPDWFAYIQLVIPPGNILLLVNHYALNNVVIDLIFIYFVQAIFWIVFCSLAIFKFKWY